MSAQPGVYQKGGPRDWAGNQERAVASSECMPWSPFKGPLSLNSGDSLLLDERKPANGKWMKAERKPLLTTQDTQKAWERRGHGAEEDWTWPATPGVTALEPRALEAPRQS